MTVVIACYIFWFTNVVSFSLWHLTLHKLMLFIKLVNSGLFFYSLEAAINHTQGFKCYVIWASLSSLFIVSYL